MSAEPEVGREEPKKRGAKSQYAEEIFERVRARVAEGMPVPTAINPGRRDDARRHPWLLAWHPFRMRRGSAPRIPYENPGISRMGFEVYAVRCLGRMHNAFT